MEEAGTGLSTVIGLFSGRKKSINSSLTKRRLTSTAKSNVDESEQMIKLYDEQVAELDQKMQEELAALKEKSTSTAGTIREVTVTPLKKDIVVELFGLAWSPVYAFKHADGWLKVAGFK
jgi:hypothetical protein